MIKNIFSSFIKISLILVLFTATVFAQTGKIAGKVTDKGTGETLIGLSVGIEGKTIGAVTDIEGRYAINNLNPGKYNVTFRYLGYQTKNITGVEVKAGQTTNLDVIMEAAATQALNEVVVTSTYRQETVGALYAQQKNAVSISSGISSDIIKRSPDKNTSEVLKRVSGASVQDGKFLVIRGLSDRYNNALLNNAILPSSEPDRKAFSFDIIPSNLIDKIVINKTASPDLPGDFSGGVTQITTKDIPDRNFINISYTAGYNTQSTFKDFVSNERGSLDFLGFSDGSRNIPSEFPGSRSGYNNNNTTTAEKISNTRLFDNPFATQVSKSLPIQSFQANWGNSSELKNDGVFGSILSLSYRNSQNYLDASRETFDGVETNSFYVDKNYRYNTTVGGLANFSYKKEKSKYSFKNLFNQTFEDNYIDRTGSSINLGNLIYSGSELNVKSLLNSQFEGEHRIGKGNSKLSWNINYSLIKRDQPDLRNIIYNENSIGQFTLIDNFTRRFFSDLNENIIGANTSFTRPVNFISKNASLKIGGLTQVRYRDFNSRSFLYEPANQSTFDQSKLTLPKEVIFNDENISSTGFVFNEITNNSDSYEGYSNLYAGFAMLDNKFGDKFRLIWGARVESYSQDIDAISNSSQRVIANQTFLDILPSFNLSYSLNDKQNVRLSGSRTVSRPELRELAPFAFINQEDNSSTTGNPALKRSNNTNIDFRYEYYPSNDEAFTATLFYKNFKNPIEQIVSSSANYSNLTFNFANAKSAYSYGFEIDFRKKLNFLGNTHFLNDLTFGTNLTLIKSEVDLNNNSNSSKRPLQGQSPYLINTSLQYSPVQSGFSFSLLYNRIGQNIVRVGNEIIPDFYQWGRDVIDFQLSKRILKNKAEFKINVGDLLNQRQVTYQNYNSNKSYQRSDDTEFYQFRSGTNISIGLTYDFTLIK